MRGTGRDQIDGLGQVSIYMELGKQDMNGKNPVSSLSQVLYVGLSSEVLKMGFDEGYTNGKCR